MCNMPGIVKLRKIYTNDCDGLTRLVYRDADTSKNEIKNLNVTIPVGFDDWYIKTLLYWFKVANLFILLDTFLDRNFVTDLLGNILAVTVTMLWTLLLIHCLAL